MRYLLDTNVVSAARRPERQDKAFQKFLRDFDMRDAFISSIAIMEIKFGIERERSRNPAFVADLERWLQDIVLAEFTDRIIGFDLAIALRAGVLPTSDRRPTVDGRP
ncbi:PIN domain-containing protein [Taklimakanibacter lacteus]|uniref:PIN domain-containing protein n=1 Tax=Taklimakanibacter lacteus TaxID=2268456 RepID=UPI000E669179